MSKVNLIIIGTAKSGTTSLFDTLSNNDEVAPSSVKEVAFFNRISEFDKGIDHYHSFFPEMNRKYVLEATPEYSARFEYPGVAQRIFDYNPDTNLIFCVRDPIDRIASQFIHFSSHFPNLYPNPASCINSVSGMKNITFRSLFNNSIQDFEKRFKKDQISIFDLDQKSKSLEKLSLWLGIDINELPQANVRNPTGKKTQEYEHIKDIIQSSAFFDLIRDDAELFCSRYGVGDNWPVFNS